MGKTRTTLAFWRGEEKRTGGENRSEKCDRQGRCQRASGMMKRRVSNGQDRREEERTEKKIAIEMRHQRASG